MAWIISPNCGAKHDTSSRYTSPTTDDSALRTTRTQGSTR